MSSPYGGHFDGSTWPWQVSEVEGWCALRDASYRYVSDACVEGSVEEFRELAAALRAGQRYRAKRCSAWIEDGRWWFCSPRNTVGGSAALPLERGAELADIIERALAGVQ